MSENKKNYWKSWAKAALIRATKTFAQTMLGGLVVGAAVSEINWLYLASVSAVAFIASILTSIVGLPEVENPDISQEVKE